MDQIKLARTLHALDYTVGAATLGYGVYTAQPLFIGFGIAGLGLAYINLSDRISTRLRKYFGRKSSQVAPPPPQLEVPVLEDAGSPIFAKSGAAYGVHQLRMQIGPDLLSQSRHSLFKSREHVNHTS